MESLFQINCMECAKTLWVSVSILHPLTTLMLIITESWRLECVALSGIEYEGDGFEGSTILESHCRWCSRYIVYHLVVVWKALLFLSNFLLFWVEIFLGGLTEMHFI